MFGPMISSSWTASLTASTSSIASVPISMRWTAAVLLAAVACKPVTPASDPTASRRARGASIEASPSTDTSTASSPEASSPSAFSGSSLAERAAAPVPELGTPTIPWAEKTAKQRLDFMGAVFFPELRRLFEAQAPERFRGFRCQTCHGRDMKERGYAMPSVAVYPLDREQPYEDALAYDPEITRFMAEDVVPTAARLLGTTPYDSATGQGLGCLTCHPAG